MYLAVLAHKKSIAASTHPAAKGVRSQARIQSPSARMHPYPTDTSQHGLRTIPQQNLPDVKGGPSSASPIRALQPPPGAETLPSNQPFWGMAPAFYLRHPPPLQMSGGIDGYQRYEKSQNRASMNIRTSFSATGRLKGHPYFSPTLAPCICPSAQGVALFGVLYKNLEMRMLPYPSPGRKR